MLKDFNNSFEYDRPSDYEGLAQLVVMGGNLYFRGWDDELGFQIWKTDGTPEGTVRVTEFPVEYGVEDWYDHQIGGLRALDDVVTFHASVENDEDTYLFKTDGTWAGTVQLTTEDGGYYPAAMKVANDKLYFSAENSKGREPWVSDGTKAGTHMIADIWPDTDGSYPYGFTGYKGAVYFSAQAEDENGTYLGRELYKTDGTDTGATLVKDINPGSDGSEPISLKVWNGTLYFSAYKGDNWPYNHYVWKTDGTSNGTVKVFEQGWGYVKPIIPLGDKLLFRTQDYSNGSLVEPTESSENQYTLFAYDGSVGDDGNATDPVALISGSILGNFKTIDRDGDKVKDSLLFMSNDGDNTTENGDPLTALYGTDGTEGDGTIMIKGGLCPPGGLDGDMSDEEIGG